MRFPTDYASTNDPDPGSLNPSCFSRCVDSGTRSPAHRSVRRAPAVREGPDGQAQLKVAHQGQMARRGAPVAAGLEPVLSSTPPLILGRHGGPTARLHCVCPFSQFSPLSGPPLVSSARRSLPLSPFLRGPRRPCPRRWCRASRRPGDTRPREPERRCRAPSPGDAARLPLRAPPSETVPRSRLHRDLPTQPRSNGGRGPRLQCSARESCPQLVSGSRLPELASRVWESPGRPCGPSQGNICGRISCQRESD